jgi:hypothetical protein
MQKGPCNLRLGLTSGLPPRGRVGRVLCPFHATPLIVLPLVSNRRQGGRYGGMISEAAGARLCKVLSILMPEGETFIQFLHPRLLGPRSSYLHNLHFTPLHVLTLYCTHTLTHTYTLTYTPSLIQSLVLVLGSARVSGAFSSPLVSCCPLCACLPHFASLPSLHHCITASLHHCITALIHHCRLAKHESLPSLLH